MGTFLEAREIYRAQISAKLQADLLQKVRLQDARPEYVAVFEVNQSYFINQHWDVRWLTKFVVPTEPMGQRHTETGLQVNYYF